MGRIVKQWIPAFIAVIVCLLTLFAGLQVRATLIEWAAIVAAFAFLLGLLNVGLVHLKAIRSPQGGLYSIVFLASMAVSFVLVVSSPDKEPAQWIFRYVIGPVGASLAALMIFTLTLAASRMLRVRRDWRTWLFILTAITVLVSSIPLLGLNWGLISGFRAFVVNVIGMAGMRGLLLGVVLGTVMTAIRALWPRSES
jgi:type IV secretory pathway VirB2 component (pilin)